MCAAPLNLWTVFSLLPIINSTENSALFLPPLFKGQHTFDEKECLRNVRILSMRRPLESFPTFIVS
jgi:hypothetical protein